MGHALTVSLSLETHTCGGCGITFGVPTTIYQRFATQGASLRCPNPSCDWHSFSIRETEAQKLQKQLDAAHNARRWAEQNLESERKSHSATKGKLTKITKRVSAGVCPCCNRTFANLARHMATKHGEKEEA